MSLTFSINGEKFQVPTSSIDPEEVLNSFIRRQTRFKGTKLACGEGGCGACVVNLSRLDPITKKEVSFSVNSCLKPLASIDGWAVTTTEGIGNSRNGFHPIQERIAKFNGSQCGFCTPGMVMTMYSSLKEAGEKGLTMEEIEGKFDGNICRCTGYRPILDACKSFASNSDIEDLIGGGEALKTASTCPTPPFPSFLETHNFSTNLHLKGIESDWVRASSLPEVFSLLEKNSADGTVVKLVVGNTSTGIYKTDKPKLYIDISNIPELLKVTQNKDNLTVGAAVTISGLHSALKSVAKPETVKAFEALSKHVLRIANVHVRNVGSIAGNLVMAKTKGFLSDLSTILLGARASVVLVSYSGKRVQSVEEFLSDSKMHPGEIVHSIIIPFAEKGEHFVTYKAALRAVNCHAYVNAAFWFKTSDKQTIVDSVLAFGGVGNDDEPGSHSSRAVKTEAFLRGKPINSETLERAIKELEKELQPRSHFKEYRQKLISGFLIKGFISISEKSDPRVHSAILDVSYRPPSRGHQAYSAGAEHLPVSQPIPKLGANLQASGEAVYTDDLPLVTGTVFGALATSKQAASRIVSINIEKALKRPGVIAVLTAKDLKVPFCSPVGQKHPLLAVDEVNYYGQPIAIVIADNERNAARGAKAVEVTYGEKVKPILTIEDALQVRETSTAGKTFTLAKGSVEETLKAAPTKNKISGKVNVGSQKHFAMEPLIAYSVPDEDGGMTVYAPHQWPAAIHGAISGVLGLPHNKVRVIQRRAGGGFGSKILHIIPIAAVSAASAQILNRPVHLLLNRNTDMEIAGGREETEAEYEASFDDNGKITALKVNGYLNSGFTLELTAFCNGAFVSSLSQAYYLPNHSISCTSFLTNLPTRTPVRGPGEIAGSYVMETVLEHIAHSLSKDPEDVRRINFYPTEPDVLEKLSLPNGQPVSYYTVPAIWEELKRKANYELKVKEVSKFNQENRWKKRGVGMIPVRYEVNIWPKSALVNVYRDGSIIVFHSGTEIGQGMHTKIAQVVAFQLGKVLGKGLDVSLVKFGDCDTFVTPNGIFTGGSTGSEASAEAARRACEALAERLVPVAESLLKEKKESAAKEKEAGGASGGAGAGEEPTITWEELTSAAVNQGVNLSAQNVWATECHYQNYGACLSVVEIDVITGETNILSSDLLYDCGKSLNPAIDIGQCEGAFLMGVGHVLKEEEIITEDGQLFTNGTWEYKPPCPKDLPQAFSVELVNNPNFDRGILSSKSSGEPPLVLAVSVGIAVRRAVAAARAEVGKTDFVELPIPLTPVVVQKAANESEWNVKI